MDRAFRLDSGDPINERRLAGLYGTALLLHAVVDPLTTYLVPGYEANPFIRWALAAGLLTFIGIHLVLIVIGSVLFASFLYLIRSADPPTNRQLARALEIGCGGLILWGLAIVGWNLSLLVR